MISISRSRGKVMKVLVLEVHGRKWLASHHHQGGSALCRFQHLVRKQQQQQPLLLLQQGDGCRQGAAAKRPQQEEEQEEEEIELAISCGEAGRSWMIVLPEGGGVPGV